MVRSVVVLVVTVLIALVVRSYHAHAQQLGPFTFTPIEVPSAGAFGVATDTKPWSINARGDIVGRYFDQSATNPGGPGSPRGFLRFADGTFARPIDAPPLNTGTVPRGNNARGDIVGKYFYPAPNINNTHGFLWPAGGTFISFDVPATAPTNAIPGSTVANALNNVGQTVGFYSAPMPGEGRPQR